MVCRCEYGGEIFSLTCSKRPHLLKGCKALCRQSVAALRLDVRHESRSLTGRTETYYVPLEEHLRIDPLHSRHWRASVLLSPHVPLITFMLTLQGVVWRGSAGASAVSVDVYEATEAWGQRGDSLRHASRSGDPPLRCSRTRVGERGYLTSRWRELPIRNYVVGA